jgi:hypothetical protein
MSAEGKASGLGLEKTFSAKRNLRNEGKDKERRTYITIFPTSTKPPKILFAARPSLE